MEGDVEGTQETLLRGGKGRQRLTGREPEPVTDGVERESEGPMVVEILVQQNARGATGPCFT